MIKEKYFFCQKSQWIQSDVYSATGQKLRTVHYTAPANIHVSAGNDYDIEHSYLAADSIDYLFGGNLTPKNGRIDKCLFDGGYAWAISTGAATDRFVFYYNKDHLGNNRELVTATGITHQVTNYYPFGAPYADPAAVSSADRQPYKYNFSVKREERKHVFSSEREKNRPKVNGKELDKMHGLRCYSKFIRFGNNDIFV